MFERMPDPTTLWRRDRFGRYAPSTSAVLAGFGVLLAGEASLALAGVQPGLVMASVLLVFAVLRPFAGLAYAMTVVVAPLGLWFVGLRAYAGGLFGGRDYALGVSASAVVAALFVVTAIRHRAVLRRHRLAVAVALLAVPLWTVIGVLHHGAAQTLVGLRLTLFPLLALAVVAGLGRRELRRLLDVLAWLLVANGVATIAEVAIGPERLATWGLEPGRALRYIDGTFRAPGLTEINAELGLLSGAYLLGYTALWLTRGAHPARRIWHAGAAASAVCLGLSTSRSGAVMLVGGLIGAVLLNRGGNSAGRRRARLIGLGIVAAVAVAFAVLGATSSSSLFERFGVWSSLLRTGMSPLGHGVGAVGAATTSRVATGTQVFVDNTFVSDALQFGPVALVALVAFLGYLLVRLSRGSATRPAYALFLALLSGLAGACLAIEAWEYAAAMLTLAVFTGYGLRLPSPTAATVPGCRSPDTSPVGPPPADAPVTPSEGTGAADGMAPGGDIFAGWLGTSRRQPDERSG